MIGHALSTILLSVVVPSTAPIDEPLDVVVVDTSDFPTIVAEFVSPPQYAAIEISATMIDVDGAAIDSVARVEPDAVVVALIVDDRPEIDADVVAAQQSSAVDLVRNIGAGSQIALATPSGLQTAFTTDIGATIARASGITAGATAVTPLPDVITGSAALLAAGDRTDRHLVVEVGGPLELSDRQTRLLSDLLVASGTKLHVIRPLDVDVDRLDDLAERSGGSASAVAEPVAGSDRVTAAIVNRYRIVTTVDGKGPHEFGLSIDGRRLTSTVDVVPTPPPTTSGSTTSEPGASGPTTAATTAGPPTSSAGTAEQRSQVPVAADAPTGSAGPAAPTLAPSRPAATSSGSSSVRFVAAAIVLFAAAATVGGLVLRRRRHPHWGNHPGVPPSPVAAPAAHGRAAPVLADPSPRPPPPIPATERRPADRTGTGAPAPAESSAHHAAPDSPWLVSGLLRMCPATGEVLVGRRRVKLEPAEFRVLQLLITNGDKGLTTRSIVEAAGLEYAGDDDIRVNALIKRLRMKTMHERSHTVSRHRVPVYFFDA